MTKKLTLKLLLSALIFIVSIQKAFAIPPIGVAYLASLAFHAGVLGIVFNNDPVSVNLPVGSGQPLTIYLDPNVPLITPAGFNAPVPPSVKPLPKSATLPPVLIYTATSVGIPYIFSASSPQSACDGFIAQFAVNGNPAVLVTCTPTSITYTKQSTGTATNNGVVTSANTCPLGSTLSGGICNVTNPALVRKPGDTPCEIIRTGNTIAVDSLNPACDSVLLPDGAKSTITPNSITINHPDGSVDQVTLNPISGNTTVITSKPNPDNTTTTNTTDISAPSGPANGGQSQNPPAVSGNGSRTDNGTGSQAGTGPGTAPGKGSGTCTDCAKEVTLQATNGLLGSIKNSVDGASFTVPTGSNPTADIQKGIDEMNKEPTKPTINWVPSILPANSMACHPLPVSIGFSKVGATATENIDICSQLDILNQFFGYLFMVGSTVYVFKCFARGNQGA
ncbi:MAG: hypothetical protein HOO97_06260 [Sideroxydans sp.]|nr:hypothetical protein [Sideroxydans sp.]